MTLIEIMVVVMIISLMMGAVAIVAWHQWVKAQIRITGQTILRVETALGQYALENAERCPPDLDELARGRILTRSPTDAWGETLLFRCPAEHDPNAAADIWSKGPDRQEGTDDDIRSWEIPAALSRSAKGARTGIPRAPVKGASPAR
jgi:general secretion pathway protein G